MEPLVSLPLCVLLHPLILKCRSEGLSSAETNAPPACVQHGGPRGVQREGEDWKGGGARMLPGMCLVYFGRYPPPHEATSEQFQINQGQIRCVILIRKAAILSPLACLEDWLKTPACNTCSESRTYSFFREWWLAFCSLPLAAGTGRCSSGMSRRRGGFWARAGGVRVLECGWYNSSVSQTLQAIGLAN